VRLFCERISDVRSRSFIEESNNSDDIVVSSCFVLQPQPPSPFTYPAVLNADASQEETRISSPNPDRYESPLSSSYGIESLTYMPTTDSESVEYSSSSGSDGRRGEDASPPLPTWLVAVTCTCNNNLATAMEFFSDEEY